MDDINEITHRIIGAAIEVHRLLGPGLFETSYEACLVHELELKGISFQRQLHLPIVYKQITLPKAYKLDLIIDQKIIVEIKAVEKIIRIHETQLLTYLKLSGLHCGLLINFNAIPLHTGIRRLTDRFPLRSLSYPLRLFHPFVENPASAKSPGRADKSRRSVP